MAQYQGNPRQPRPGPAKWPNPVADMISLVPTEFNEWLTENLFDLEAVVRVFHNARNIFSQALAMDRKTWKFVPQIVATHVARNMVADNQNFPGIAAASDEPVTSLYDIFVKAQERKAAQVKEQTDEAEQKKADAKKLKPAEQAACIRKVHAAAQSLVQGTFPVLSARLRVLLWGNETQTGFFQALADTYSPEDVETFYVKVGHGEPAEIKQLLTALLQLRNVDHMLEEVEAQCLITLKP